MVKLLSLAIIGAIENGVREGFEGRKHLRGAISMGLRPKRNFPPPIVRQMTSSLLHYLKSTRFKAALSRSDPPLFRSASLLSPSGSRPTSILSRICKHKLYGFAPIVSSVPAHLTTYPRWNFCIIFTDEYLQLCHPKKRIRLSDISFRYLRYHLHFHVPMYNSTEIKRNRRLLRRFIIKEERSSSKVV